MRALAKLLWVFALPVFSIGGCSEVTTPPDTAQIRLSIKDNIEQTPLEGAKACQTDTERPNCVTTNAMGNETLVLPAYQKLSYTVEKEGYGSILYPLVTGSGPASLDSNMRTDEWLKDTFDNLQSPYPFIDRGAIQVVMSPRFAGATLELVTATGEPFYTDEEDHWRSDLEATTSGGTGRGIFFSICGFFEVPPGEAQIKIGGTAQSCILSVRGNTVRGWPGDDINMIRVPVREGLMTRVVVLCAEAP